MPRVVTMGGGHGQAALLSALCLLDVEITAIVSVADDGGCSGALRRELGMPPPGDLRRCLTALARDRALAERFEVRLSLGDGVTDGDDGEVQRSAGNLALSEAFAKSGSLQSAVDWAAELLACRGRVVPVAETEGVLTVYDMDQGAVEGETNVDKTSSMPVIAVVHGPEHTNPVATAALEAADLILMGPGSFFTSTLATITTAQIAAAIAHSPATKVFLGNIGNEDAPGRILELADQVRLVRDHLTIGSGEHVSFSVLRHHDAVDGEPAFSRDELADATPEMRASLASPGTAVHDVGRLADALVHHLGLRRKRQPSYVPLPRPGADATFEQHLERAKQRLQSVPPQRPRD